MSNLSESIHFAAEPPKLLALAAQRTPAGILRQARSLLDEPCKHVQGHMAVDAGGAPVSTTSSTAVRRCAVGALNAAMLAFDVPHPARPAAVKYLHRAAAKVLAEAFTGRALPPVMTGPEVVNDRLGWASTVRMFDIAISLAENAGHGAQQ